MLPLNQTNGALAQDPGLRDSTLCDPVLSGWVTLSLDQDPNAMSSLLFPFLHLRAFSTHYHSGGVDQRPKDLLDSYLWDLFGILWLDSSSRRTAWSVIASLACELFLLLDSTRLSCQNCAGVLIWGDSHSHHTQDEFGALNY